MDTDCDRAPPFGRAAAKRVIATARLQFDWHDFLLNRREPGRAYIIGDVTRPVRLDATGLQYRCTVAGVTLGDSFTAPLRWPRQIGGILADGGVTWTAEALSNASLRSTILGSLFPSVTGITLSGEVNNDFIYTIYASGGTLGENYEVRHRVTLSGGPPEVEEGLMILPVRD